ncbi:MAG: hypothetical protein EZS28_036084, partial [Streblomastix strix]
IAKSFMSICGIVGFILGIFEQEPLLFLILRGSIALVIFGVITFVYAVYMMAVIFHGIVVIAFHAQFVGISIKGFGTKNTVDEIRRRIVTIKVLSKNWETLTIQILRRGLLSSKVTAGVVNMLLVSPCVVKAAEPMLRVALPPYPAYSTYLLRESQFPTAALRRCHQIFALVIFKRVVVIWLVRDRHVDCVARIDALCMRLQRTQSTELTYIFGMVLNCVHPCFLYIQMAEPQGWTARGSIRSLRPAMVVSQQRSGAIERSDIKTLSGYYSEHSDNGNRPVGKSASRQFLLSQLAAIMNIILCYQLEMFIFRIELETLVLAQVRSIHCKKYQSNSGTAL